MIKLKENKMNQLTGQQIMSVTLILILFLILAVITVQNIIMYVQYIFSLF